MSSDRSQPLVVHPEVAFALADGLGRAGDPLAAAGGALAAVDDPVIGPALLDVVRAADAAAFDIAGHWRGAADAMTMAIAATHAADLAADFAVPVDRSAAW